MHCASDQLDVGNPQIMLAMLSQKKLSFQMRKKTSFFCFLHLDILSITSDKNLSAQAHYEITES